MSSRRVTAISVGLSVALHVVVLILYSVSSLDLRPGVVLPVGDAPSTPVQGTRIVRLIELPADDPNIESPEDPAPEPEPDAPKRPAPAVQEPGAPVELVPVGVRAAWALRVRSVDLRLWRAASPEAHALTDEEIMVLELSGRLEAWNDSIRALVEAESALTDWTRTDANGDRWGVSPGKLHLGKLTLPLPFGFGPNPWQAERAARRAFEDADIRNAAAASLMAEHWKTRIEAIRLRRDRERESERADSTKAKPGGPGGNS